MTFADKNCYKAALGTMFYNWTSWFSGLAGSHWIQATEVLPHNCLVAVRLETLNAAGHLIKRWDGLESFLNSWSFPFARKIIFIYHIEGWRKESAFKCTEAKKSSLLLGDWAELGGHTIGLTDPKILLMTAWNPTCFGVIAWSKAPNARHSGIRNFSNGTGPRIRPHDRFPFAKLSIGRSRIPNDVHRPKRQMPWERATAAFQTFQITKYQRFWGNVQMQMYTEF